MKNNVLKNDVTKNESASERAVALVHEALDVLQRAEHAPDSPVDTFLTADRRRKYRRDARRLREQETQRAEAAANRIVLKAREQADSEHALMVAMVKRDIGHLVVETTAAVAGKVLTLDDHRRLVHESTRQLKAA